MRRLSVALSLAVVLLATPAQAVFQCGDTQDTCQCGRNNPYPCCSNGGNCTWYAWHSACCNWSVGPPGWGNANTWAQYARANASYAVSSYAVSNAVSCRDVGTYGHVAYVTALSGANVSVREQNCWGNYGVRSASYAASFWTGGFITRAGQVACRPGDSQTQSCGNCGTQRRGCGNDGKWGSWGACSSEGACRPGAEEETACGDCGTHRRSCTASCQWGGFNACAGPDPTGAAAACETGVTGACGAGSARCVAGQRTCEQTVHPVPETCDQVDNDCDGVIDGPVCAAAGVYEVAPGVYEVAPPRDGGSGTQAGGGSMQMVGSCTSGPGLPAVTPLLWALLALARCRRRAHSAA